jgi:hypothetical protein
MITYYTHRQTQTDTDTQTRTHTDTQTYNSSCMPELKIFCFLDHKPSFVMPMGMTKLGLWSPMGDPGRICEQFVLLLTARYVLGER